MIYNNPVIKGFYPDPSVCFADGKYYMVCSSFQYFPGVPLFESADLVNWKQVGYCLTRKSQVVLDEATVTSGVFAPTIRYNNGTFYMVTTNTSENKNFYIKTDDIYGEWSDPVYVEQGGIDPSLLFDDGHVYFISNGTDDFGQEGVTQCEIDIETGKKLSPSRNIWKGSGGRFLESPHMYKINGEYYLMAAEGGTEYGHMITYARSNSVWGEFKGYKKNPVLTNRNLGGFVIQGVGHGDLIQKRETGEWFILHLGFRQLDEWMAYHYLGREVFMTPVHFGGDGWFTAGNNGTTEKSYEIQGDFVQEEKKIWTFANTEPNIDWCFMRHPDLKDYEFSDDKFVLHGNNNDLCKIASPTFIGLRQKDFNGKIKCKLTLNCDKDEYGEAGITLFMDEQQHYDLTIKKISFPDMHSDYDTVLQLSIGDIKNYAKAHMPIRNVENSAELIIGLSNFVYSFKVIVDGREHDFGTVQTKYLSSEVASGFTGVMIGLYAVRGTAEFTDFRIEYK